MCLDCFDCKLGRVRCKAQERPESNRIKYWQTNCKYIHVCRSTEILVHEIQVKSHHTVAFDLTNTNLCVYIIYIYRDPCTWLCVSDIHMLSKLCLVTYMYAFSADCTHHRLHIVAYMCVCVFLMFDTSQCPRSHLKFICLQTQNIWMQIFTKMHYIW